MADFRSEDLVAEAEAETEAPSLPTPIVQGFDEVLGNAVFDAAVTASRERVVGVYVEEAPPTTEP